MTRAAPQVNIFAVGFALTLVVGIAMLAVQMNQISGPMQRLFDLQVSRLSELLGTGLK
jgi:flagellar biosynthesis protein FliR